MASNMPAFEVASPTWVAPSYGLFSVLSPRENAPDRWQTAGGVVFDKFGVLEDLSARVWDSTNPCAVDYTPNHQLEGGELLSPQLYTTEGIYECSPVGVEISRAQALAATRLDRLEELQLETAFWATLEDSADSLGQSFTVTGADLNARLASFAEGLAAIEFAQLASWGAVGVIHMPRGLALLGLERGLLEVSNKRLYTKLGTPVAAGSGYGNPEGATPTPLKVLWSFPLVSYRSPVYFVPPVYSGGFDRGQNILRIVAARDWLVTAETTAQ